MSPIVVRSTFRPIASPRSFAASTLANFLRSSFSATSRFGVCADSYTICARPPGTGT